MNIIGPPQLVVMSLTRIGSSQKPKQILVLKITNKD